MWNNKIKNPSIPTRPQIEQQHTHANWLQSSMKKCAKKWNTCKAQRKNKCKESRKAWQT